MPLSQSRFVLYALNAPQNTYRIKNLTQNSSSTGTSSGRLSSPAYRRLTSLATSTRWWIWPIKEWLTQHLRSSLKASKLPNSVFRPLFDSSTLSDVTKNVRPRTSCYCFLFVLTSHNSKFFVIYFSTPLLSLPVPTFRLNLLHRSYVESITLKRIN